MNTKIVLFTHCTIKIQAFFTRLLTKCNAYHCGILIEDSDYLYDMYFMRRRRKWSEIKDSYSYEIVEAPIEIPETYLINEILNHNEAYGFKDFLKFGIRPLYHLIGKSTHNSNGIICSGMVAADLSNNGWSDMPEAWYKEEPSPCDLYRAFKK